MNRDVAYSITSLTIYRRLEFPDVKVFLNTERTQKTTIIGRFYRNHSSVHTKLSSCFTKLVHGSSSFWNVVYSKFLAYYYQSHNLKVKILPKCRLVSSTDLIWCVYISAVQRKCLCIFKYVSMGVISTNSECTTGKC